MLWIDYCDTPFFGVVSGFSLERVYYLTDGYYNYGYFDSYEAAELRLLDINSRFNDYNQHELHEYLKDKFGCCSSVRSIYE